MIAPARRAAYQVLRAVSDDTLDLPAALAASRDPLRDPRDRALAGEIAIGTLRWRNALDAMIERLTRRRLARLDAEVVDILRSALYQLWQLQRVPPSAVVNDAVELTRLARRGRASALVNAALRAFGRVDAASLLPSRPVGPAEDREGALDYLSITLSHPRWLVERWLERYGFENTERWLLFNNSPAALTLRVNTEAASTAHVRAQLADLQVTAVPAHRAPDALVVESGNPLRTPLFERGLFIVQDEASQLVAHEAAVRSGERVLDACASPGGKTLVMSNTAGGGGRMIAADVRGRRVALLRETLLRTGIRAAVVQMDLFAPAPFLPAFDCVLVDVPCSGLGTVRRDPDVKWRRTAADLPVLAAIQEHLLANAASAVAAGGRLVYATCSSEPDENDEVVSGFLQSTRGFRLARPPFRTTPPSDGLEAFFAAVLVKDDAV